MNDSTALERLDGSPIEGRDGVLAHARRTRRTIRRSASASTTSSRRRSRRSTDPVARRDVPQADGRVARARRRHRLHAAAGGKDRPVRPPARRARSPASRCSSRRRCRSAASRPGCWSRATRGGRRRSKATRCIPAASARPTSSRRPRSSASTIPIASQTLTQPRRDPAVVGVPRRDPRGADGAAAAQGRRPSHPHRIGQLADARRADPRSARALPVGEVASVGSGRAATTRAPARGSPSASTSTRSTASIRPTSSSSLDADFLGCGPGRLRYAREFAARRRPEHADAHEPALRRRERCRRRPARAPIIGCRCRPSDDRGVARALAAAVGVGRRGAIAGAPSAGRGRSKCVDGGRQGSAGASRREPRHRRRRPAAGRPRARARDERRRSATSARRSSTPTRSKPSRSISSQSLRDLVADMNAGKVDLLVILGGNPVYTAPADLRVRRRAGQGAAARPPRACTTTRRRRCVTGRFPKRTSSRRGATRAATTAPSRSSSR